MENTDLQRNIEKMGKERFEKIGHEYYGDKCARVLASITKHFIKNDILDCGAGTGALMLELKRRGYTNINGIDLYPKVDFVQQGDITNLKFANASLNTVFFMEVMEHLTDEQILKTLSESSRVLRKGGHLIITTPFSEQLLENTIKCPFCEQSFHRYGHLRTFDKKVAIATFEKYGFKTKFFGVYALGAMSKLPMGRYLNWFFKKLKYKSISQSLVLVLSKT